ncbi:hypothetical protein LVY72_00995 [Arthrobacter sp. I2-34]|uniref:Uncharacterized protein n=1 Tax=Arthrobacter hankyongi TaxID=2904801 RepID=A0ABS9L1G6_9MICC|nr:hypothetical protein [Arthrobacter hankyongi]MCG2620484.1 hypothetical protein [Arthrobacter hankyongi]
MAAMNGGPARVTREPYGREPYVRARIGRDTVDGKAIAWTRTEVQVKWVDRDGAMRTDWVPAQAVRRISRDESAWRDPYDDYGFYYPADGTDGGPGNGPPAARHDAAK